MLHKINVNTTAKYLLMSLFFCNFSFAQIDSSANTQKEISSLALNKSSGMPLDGQIIVDPNNPSWLKYNGGGPFFLAGPGDPEGFLYRGTLNADGTRSGDQMNLINKLKTTGANSIYLMAIRSHGGDGDATENPFVDHGENNAINLAVLDQWETWFTEMDNNGIVIYFFIYDDSTLIWGGDEVGGLESNLIQTLVNRFEHHKNLIWVVAEEYAERYSPLRISNIAALIRETDDHNHVIAVHKNSGLLFDEFAGDPNIDQFAIQYNVSDADTLHQGMVTAWENAEGRYNLNMSEAGNYGSGTTARLKNWAVAMGGAYVMILTMDIESTPIADLLDLGDLSRFMESTNFNEMIPSDQLALGDTKYVLAKLGDSYIAYTANYSVGIGLQNMGAGEYSFNWFDISTGESILVEQVIVGAGDNIWLKPSEITGNELAVHIKLSAILPESALSIAAASMEAGQSMSFDTVGFDYDLVNACGAATFIVDWARDAVWNSINREIHFIGQGHYACQKHIKYLESDNTWYEVSRADWEDVGIGHAYEHNTIDPETGAFYYGRFNSKKIEKYLNGNWTTLPSFPGPKAITRAIEYFPEMDGLVVFDRNAGVLLFNETTDEWSVLSTPVEMGAYHVFAEYSPIHEVIIFGGGNGSTKVNKLNANGIVDTNIADSPVVLGVASDQGLVQVDTSTGNFLAFLDDNTQYEYDVTSDSWRFFDDENISISSTISVVIPEHEVILFASRSGVVLYKLGGSSGLTTVTLNASSILVNSGETVVLDWDSSNTDNCEATGGWSGSRAVSGSETSPTITANTTFVLTCTGATGFSSKSVTINVVNTDPVVILNTSSTQVDSGDTVSLSWNSVNTNSCEASEGWGGSRAISGNETSDPITTTTNFILTCTGTTGSSSSSVTVSINNGGAVFLGSGAIIIDALVYDENNGTDWSIQNNLQVTDTMYGDRNYSFTQIPTNLLGHEWLSTANDSKSFVGEDLVTFTLAQDAEVFILHRDDIANKPEWLFDWADTNNDVINSEPRTYSVFSRNFSAGNMVSLGENGSTGSGMYIVVVVSTTSSTELIFADDFEE